MAMTVLPSFQAFLESTAQMPRPLSPLRVHAPQQHELQYAQFPPSPPQQQQYGYHGYQSPLGFAPHHAASPVAADAISGQYLPSLWKSGPRSSSSSFSHGATSSEEDNDDDDDAHDQLLMLRARAHTAHYAYRHRSTSPTARRYASTVGLQASPLALTSNASPQTLAAKRVKKKYLKERERCEIVRRVLAGEKQAHLAKEFGVSRAAVCYLLKHQMEILSRSAQRL